MDIHKIKPVHGWKEFFSEIGIIVIGVLIALGGESAVEALHWRHQVEQERDSLHANAQQQLDVIVSRQVQQACVDHRLAELATVFARHKARQAFQLLGPVGRPQNNAVDHGAWDVALADQAIGHMKLEERDDLAGAFKNFDNLHELRIEADRDWIELAVLDQPDLLEDGDWVELRKAYARAAATEGRIKAVIPFVLENANLGLKPASTSLDESLQADYSKAFCRPLLAPAAASAASATAR